MYSIIIEYGDYAFYDYYRYKVIKLTEMVAKFSIGKVFESMDDAKETLNKIVNATLNELKEISKCDLFLKFINDEVVMFDNDGDFIARLLIKETETRKSPKKENPKICTISKNEFKNPIRYIDIHVPFLVKINRDIIDITAIRYEENKLFLVYYLNKGNIFHKMYKGYVLKKEDVLDSYIYVYEEILRLISEDMI